ncbi:MAG TPA: hypothetical protein VF590_25030 [Isosphaeraceae bacterium]|jgi:hypothetical protein
MRLTWPRLALAAALVPAATAVAQPPPEARPKTIALRPAAEPVPALKYRLVPERRQTEPGNAALFYHRAIQYVIEGRVRLAFKAKVDPGARPYSADEAIARWVTGPIDAIPRHEARAQVDDFANVLREVALGAARRECDWGFDRRAEGIGLLLPEIQETRALARLVALKARLAILDGQTDEALRWIRIGLSLGGHVADGPTLIQALVGVAISSTMVTGLEDLIQAPGTPSLYWALADRRRPFIDMRYPMEGERYMLEKELPALEELDTGVWSVERARRFVDELQEKLYALASGEPIPGTSGAIPGGLPDLARRLGIAAMAAKVYPEARKNLRTLGRPAEVVDAMPVVQVAALSTLLEYYRLRDETYKWMNLPYWQSARPLQRAESLKSTAPEKLANPLLALFRLITPAVNAARLAGVRLDRQLDALQAIESIRMYAAAHDGKFPPDLAALEAPAPIDPATGRPFEYKVDGDSATLSAPVPVGVTDVRSYAIRYELRPAR